MGGFKYLWFNEVILLRGKDLKCSGVSYAGKRISEKWFNFENILLYMLVFLTRLQEHWEDKSHSRYKRAHLLGHQCNGPQWFDPILLPGVTGCSATPYAGNLELTSMYGETLCSLSAGYDSWDKLFSDPGHPQLLSWCCGAAVDEWLVWKSGW